MLSSLAKENNPKLFACLIFLTFSCMQDKIKWRWSLLSVLVSGAIMQFQGRSLKTASNPIGIIDLELADTVAKLNGLMANWDVHIVRLNIWIDFLFIAAYTFFFIQSLRLLIVKHRIDWLQKAGKQLFAFAYIAASLDVVENILMLYSISGQYSASSVFSTAVVASCKFALIAVILLYLIGSLLLTFNRKLASS